MICIKFQVISPEVIQHVNGVTQEDPDALLNYYWNYYVWLPVNL